MREMVLNHASLQASNQYTAVEWLKGMMDGMSEYWSTMALFRQLYG